jgi:hypothetical protein
MLSVAPLPRSVPPFQWFVSEVYLSFGHSSPPIAPGPNTKSFANGARSFDEPQRGIQPLVRDMILGSNLQSPILIDVHAGATSFDEGAKFSSGTGVYYG